MSNPQPIVKIQNVRQAFRSGFWMRATEILSDITLSIPEGSVYGVLGPNGAGKTTLIHLIAGFKTPKAGSIQVCGLEANTQASRAQIGYLPERPYFADFLTGEGFLFYMGRLAGMEDAEIAARIPTVLQQVGMSHAAKLELKKYSKGMLQRIGIAQAILHDPKIILFDEPMSGLDPMGRQEVRELLVQLSRLGKTIIFSTHMMQDVEAICTHACMIKKGQLAMEGPIESFFAQQLTKTQVVLRGITEQAFRALSSKWESVERGPWGWLGVLPDAKSAGKIAHDATEQGAEIVSIKPVRPQLEEILRGGGA